MTQSGRKILFLLTCLILFDIGSKWLYLLFPYTTQEQFTPQLGDRVYWVCDSLNYLFYTIAVALLIGYIHRISRPNMALSVARRVSQLWVIGGVWDLLNESFFDITPNAYTLLISAAVMGLFIWRECEIFKKNIQRCDSA